MTIPSPRRRPLTWASGLLCLLVLATQLPGRAGAQPQAAAAYTVFLPSLSAPGTPPPPPPPLAAGGVFLRGDIRTTSSAMALDAAGGAHVAYVAYEPSSAGPPAYYGYCAPGKDCLNPASWQLSVVGSNAEQVQLQLTPAGRPRILYRTRLNDLGLSHDYYYAECDSGCGGAAGWRSLRIGGTTRVDPLEWDLPHRSFALDRLGRPRFVYYTGTPGESNKGAFYLSCDRNCTAPGSWERGAISLGSTYGDEIFDEVALTFTSANQPRLVTNITADYGGIYYMACDAGCTDSANWERSFLASRGYGPLASWDIELNADDQPRVALYLEGFADGGGDVLFYAWCDADCAGKGDAWYGGPVGLPKGEGQTPDLELDARGRPRIAYHAVDTSSLGYLWCDTACESDAAAWGQQVLEPSAALDARYPVAVPPACEQGAWSSGYQPMLALDAAGNPHVASEARRMLRCLERDPQDPTAPPQSRVVAFRHARFLFATKP